MKEETTGAEKESEGGSVKNLLSLGAGVQSSTMAWMAAHGLITPMPDAAIFADTQAEPPAVYGWLDWLEKQLPFPVHRVTAGSLTNTLLTLRTSKKTGKHWSGGNIPYFVTNKNGKPGKVGRHCTRDFKIRPLTKEAYRLAGIKRGQKTIGVIQWIGISLDEIVRCKPSAVAWCKHRWPLIEMRMRRSDCLKWMRENGYPEPPRSACVYCPFHSNTEWNRLKTDEPEAFAEAARVERELQSIKSQVSNMRGVPYLHGSCVPIEAADFSNREESLLWQDECEGMCGV